MLYIDSMVLKEGGCLQEALLPLKLADLHLMRGGDLSKLEQLSEWIQLRSRQISNVWKIYTEIEELVSIESPC